MRYITDEEWKIFFQESKNNKSNRNKLIERNKNEE